LQGCVLVLVSHCDQVVHQVLHWIFERIAQYFQELFVGFCLLPGRGLFFLFLDARLLQLEGSLDLAETLAFTKHVLDLLRQVLWLRLFDWLGLGLFFGRRLWRLLLLAYFFGFRLQFVGLFLEFSCLIGQLLLLRIIFYLLGLLRVLSLPKLLVE
jgi:hypothetical protein